MLNLLLWSSVIPATILLFAFLLLRFRPRKFIDKLPGPPSSSWLVGNIPELAGEENVGDTEFRWVEKYGTIFKFKGAFGEDVLHLTDPKAVQYVLSSGRNFKRPKEILALIKLFSGESVLSAEGSDHARHRKIMDPAFSYTSLKGFMPIFSRIAQKASKKWRGVLKESGGDSTVIDVAYWLPRLTLDVIGEAAFDYKFGALDNDENELSNVYHNLFTDTFYRPSNADIIFRAIWAYTPLWTIRLLHYLPLPGMERIRNLVKVSFEVAKRLVDREITAISEGKPPRKDAMSLLVRANSGENPKGKLSDYELLSEMSSLMVAGHETTSSTLAWLLYELSRRPDYQQKIREETKTARGRAAARGDESLTITDFESMTYTVAAMKETLRLDSITILITRTADHDDAIPLSKPHRSVTGEVFTSVPVSKGQNFRVSVHSYNRLEDVWGEDTHLWKPERFIDGSLLSKQKTSLGVYANLATFSSGPHACVGWRFALAEIQSVIIELLDNFAFTPAPGYLEILKAPTMIMSPMVKGQTSKGTQMPLQVTLI